MTKSSHFVFIHGSCVGGWCWYKLLPLLQSAGHRTTAVDLGASGINPKQVEGLSTILDYFEPLFKTLAALPSEEKVILVGHSMGGVATSVAMERFPEKVSVAVFVTAYMPGPHLTANKITRELHLTSADETDTISTAATGNRPATFLFGPNYISSILYSRSPPEDIALASTVVRPFPDFSGDEKSSRESTLTTKNYGSVPRVYIISEQDRGLTKQRQLTIIEDNPPNEVREVFGSDHMVMCSKPQDLSSHLQQIAVKYD